MPVPSIPRLDWTVGRRGIPYLDWGPHTGKNWTRKQSYGGPYNAKKNTYYKSQSGSYTDKSSWTEGYTASNVNIIRFADVILWLAEIEVEVGSLTEARNYVNMIRAQSRKPCGLRNEWCGTGGQLCCQSISGWRSRRSVWFSKYRENAVHFERKLELGMEGHRFFDLVRWDEAESTLNCLPNL